MSRHRAWSLPLGSVSQTPVRLHLSFLLLGALVAFEASASPDTFTKELSFIIALFMAVVIHEASHYAAALRMGVGTREVLLYPFGGVLTLARQVGPRAELAITCAGPIGSGVAAILSAPFAQNISDPNEFLASSFATKFFAANVVLVVCNLIPAFPLDGGRILKNALKIFKTKRSTEIVVRVSQTASILLGVLALATVNVFLIVIAAIIFSYSIREMVRTQALALGERVEVSQAMIPVSQLVVLSHGTTIADACAKAVRSFNQVFPVVTAGNVRGYVTRDDLLSAATRADRNDYVGALTEKQFLTLPSSISSSEAAERMDQAEAELAFVIDEGDLKGLLLKDKLTEYLLLKGVREQVEDSRAADREDPFS